MGQGASKDAPSSTQHVFKSSGPVSFSQELVDSLQNSPESDSTRSKDLELHIQSRVQAELTRLEAEQDKAIKAIQETLSKDPSGADSSPQVGFDGRAKADKLKDLGRESVLKEIEALRTRLNHRKIREEIVNDKAVEKAKSELVTCLRLNDRRPLDCWKEVESFKQEVGRLEKGFLGRILQ